MKIPKLQIGNIISEIPILQGGMGVRVSLSSLASAVANEGGIGTIASVGIGDMEDSKDDLERISREAMVREIHRAQSLTDGHIAINVMAVLSNANDLIRTAVKEGIKPAVVEDSSVNLLPIISCGRAAKLVLHAWDKRYGRTADAIILEGPLAGGHLGFSREQLKEPEKYSLINLLPDVLEEIKTYEDKFGKKIPVIAAGGIYDGKDIARMLLAGASGVQMATRFVCTVECGVSQKFKQAYLDVEEKDIVIIDSPVGLPGRAIRNKFLKDLEIKGKLKINCPYKCLSTCNVKEARYCIAQALLNAYFGDLDNSVIFCGQNAFRITKIVSVKELVNELITELEAF